MVWVAIMWSSMTSVTCSPKICGYIPATILSVLSDVKVGDFVGVNVTGEGGGKLGVVEELWVLPNLRPVR